jgi:hypothetical protein
MNLPQKLQMKPGKSWLLYNAPSNYLATLEPLPEGVSTSYDAAGEFDGIQLFVKDSAELISSLKIVIPHLKYDGVFWVTYPKKASGIKTDLGMTKNWDEMLVYNYTTVTAISINDDWTALRFRPVEQSKSSDSCNTNIPNNEYGNYIDLANRIITPPAEIIKALAGKPQAMGFFEQLSFSNKKEYVVWILSAKQEKTKADRLEKMVEKLAAGKKNPSEK